MRLERELIIMNDVGLNKGQLLIENGEMRIAESLNNDYFNSKTKGIHIYGISPDPNEIKGGDWFVHYQEKNMFKPELGIEYTGIHQCEYVDGNVLKIKDSGFYNNYKVNCKKIVVTTRKELWLDTPWLDYKIDIPQFPIEFIE